MEPLDELALVVGLAYVTGAPEFDGEAFETVAHVGERVRAIDGGLAAAEQVQVGPVEDEHAFLGHGQIPR
jgi:hypothetical protein